MHTHMGLLVEAVIHMSTAILIMDTAIAMGMATPTMSMGTAMDIPMCLQEEAWIPTWEASMDWWIVKDISGLQQSDVSQIKPQYYVSFLKSLSRNDLATK